MHFKEGLVLLSREQELRIIEHVRDVAAAEIMPRFRCLPEKDVDTKSSFDDLVTVADLASERELTKRFKTLLPDANVLGEEAVAEDPSLLSSIGQAELTIIIDPIDGTWNFANGLATFGVLIAAIYQGKTIFGLLYDPVNDDWIEASLGKGCWYAKPNHSPRQIHLSPEAKDPRWSGVLSPFLFVEPLREKVAVQQLQYARTGALRCCCHEYRTLIQGGYDFFISPKPKVWDHAAGILAYQEAGGAVFMLSGDEYRATIETGVIVAARNQAMLNRLIADFSSIL